MKAALAKGPVSVTIEADKPIFKLYKNGIITDYNTCGMSLDHGVAAVGYGSEGGQDYYIVRNSWTTSWGEKGYVRFAVIDDQKWAFGMCGILKSSSQPTTD